MWPAGLGGQYAYWDDALKAYLISEPTRKNHGYLGSPAARGISYTPAHMLSDVPNQFKIEIADPKAVAGRFIPIVIAGGKGAREDVKKAYQAIAADPAARYRRAVEIFRRPAPLDAGRPDARPGARPGLRMGQGRPGRPHRRQPRPRPRARRRPGPLGHRRTARLRLVLRHGRLPQLVEFQRVRELRRLPRRPGLHPEVAAQGRQDGPRAVAGRGLSALVGGLSLRLHPRRHVALLHHRRRGLCPADRRPRLPPGELAFRPQGLRLVARDRRATATGSWTTARPGSAPSNSAR